MKRIAEYGKSLCMVLVFSALAGCTATTQPSKFYLLNALSSSVKASSRTPAGLAIGVGPIDIPEYVDRPQIVTRVSENELNLAEFHKWAAPLKDNIPQVLAENLSVLLKTDRVASYPWKRTTPIDYQVTITIARFDTAPDGAAHLIARWSILGESGRPILDTRKEHFTAPLQGSDYAATVSALNQAINDLSRAVADSLVRVHSKTKKKK